MNNIGTPKPNSRRRSKFVSPATSYKSPLLNKPVTKVVFDPSRASLEELKQQAVELWQKNEEMKNEIEILKNQGFEEEQLKWYIDKLHEYNDIKDIAQNIMGRIAVSERTTIRKIHEEFGMTDSD
ncbi:hypothetical protein JTE90_000982 [Oedothorax gibbosus]|uniref:DNA repair protein SWI5 homolog n=1 Tax=Oedothorax gibbosus TaxID=931172 RepID=A0AAV6VBW2_9ARAC|nr:hypothetical protein JTE90_000982 [Oedothorax gibbosus]